LAKFTRSDVQSGRAVTASYFLYWKKQFQKHVDSNSEFHVLTRRRRQLGETYMTQWKHDFSDLSGKCFRRLREQLSLRFERNQRNPDLSERTCLLENNL